MNPQPAVAWTTSGAADGNSVTAAGLFTAGTTVGQFAVTAQSGTAAATAQVQVVAAGAPVTLISPVGGESFRVGDVMTVRWTAVNNINAIVVQVRPNDASGWYKIVQSYVLRTDGNWGAYQWTVTPTIGDNVPLVSSQARVRVYNYWVETEEAISPAVFSIVPSDRIVMAPLTGGAGGVSLRQTGHGFTVVLPDAMQYRLELFSPLGARYQTMHRAGPAQVDIDRVPLGAGSLIMRLMTGDEVICRQVLQFE